MHNITVFYHRFHLAYQRTAAQVIAICFDVCEGYRATDVYDAIDMLEMHEYFATHVRLLRDYQDEQIPLRFD